MFTTPSAEALCRALDHYPFPMFAAQRDGPADAFRLIANNAAHTRATGLTAKDITGTRTCDLLSGYEAQQVERRFAHCLEQDDIINYRETLHIKGTVNTWETTLQPIHMASGAQRVVGTSLSLNLPSKDMALSNTEYFAAQAQMQLAQIQVFLDSLEIRADLPCDTRERAMMVNGLSRSVDRLLMDIRISSRALEPMPVAASHHGNILVS